MDAIQDLKAALDTARAAIERLHDMRTALRQTVEAIEWRATVPTLSLSGGAR